MSKFNESIIDFDTPKGTKLKRISDEYSCMDIGTICYLNEVKYFESSKFGYIIDVCLSKDMKTLGHGFCSNFFEIIED